MHLAVGNILGISPMTWLCIKSFIALQITTMLVTIIKNFHHRFDMLLALINRDAQFNIK